MRGEAGLSPENFITYILFFTQIINPAKSCLHLFTMHKGVVPLLKELKKF